MRDVTITTAEIRAAWDQIQRGEMPFSERQKSAGVYRHAQTTYRGAKVDSWIGCSGEQMQGWLHNGYFADGELAAQLPGGQVDLSMPMVDLVEEDGDLLVDQVLNGEDLTYARWEEFEAKRGLTIQVNIGMAAGTDANVLADYLTWVLKVIDAAERQGIAPDVELVCGARDGFIRSKDAMKIRIPLVKGGEIVDATAWRAFMAPGGFRTLGFVALALGADRLKHSLTVGMGRPIGEGWTVRFEDDVLSIDCPISSAGFPETRMDAELEAAYGGA